MQIFKHNHKEYEFNAGMTFNLIILEIGVLLSMRKESPLLVESSETPAIPISMHQQWLDEQSRIVDDRRQWLDHRETLARPENSLTEKEIFDETAISSWAAFQEGHLKSAGPNNISPLFSILHRFMYLSSVIAPIVGGDINKNWMELALQLMLQSALEVLSTAELSNEHSTNNETAATNGHPPQVPGLIECFAFGYLPSITDSQSVSETEQAINAMFAASSSTSPDKIENPDWVKLRSEYLSEFRHPNHTVTKDTDSTLTKTIPTRDFKAYEARIARLKHKFPFEEVEANLLRCLEHFWAVNCDSSVSGKPVLVQVEEGRLDGLNEKEFEEFLGRVGLQRDKKGAIDFKIYEDDSAESKEDKT